MYGPRAPCCDLPGLRGRLAAANETTLRPLGLGGLLLGPGVLARVPEVIAELADGEVAVLADRRPMARWRAR